MSNKYISPEHAIKNILSEGNPTKQAEWWKSLFDIKIEPETPSNAVVPVTPKNVEVPAVESPSVKTDVAPATTTTPAAAPAVRTDTAPVVDTNVAPAVRTDTAPVVDTNVAPAVRTNTAPAVRTETNPKLRDGEPPNVRSTTPRIRAPNFIGGITPGQSIAIGNAGTFNVPNYLHMAGERRVFEENEADKKRREIVSVPRPSSKREETMTRSQEIKQKIVEENAKKKVIIKNAVDAKYSKAVEINPEYKHEKLNEGSGLKRAIGAGAAGTLGGVATNQEINKYTGYDPNKSEMNIPFVGKIKEPDWMPGLQTGLDLLSMAPVVGAVPSLINAGIDASKGDWLNAGLNFAGVVPGVKWGTNAMKYGGKGLTLGAKLTPALARTADVVQGGTHIPTSGILAGTKTGKVIDKAADSFERNVATPANMFQLGAFADAMGLNPLKASPAAAAETKVEEPKVNRDAKQDSLYLGQNYSNATPTVIPPTETPKPEEKKPLEITIYGTPDGKPKKPKLPDVNLPTLPASSNWPWTVTK